jgi:glycosyltransferase involved in cell wall biosynthesis
MMSVSRSRPLVSIVMAAFNAERYIAEALDSVAAQSGVAWELVVVDDGSTDATAERIARHPVSARYIYQDNQGPSAARNAGLEATVGDFVVFLDSDDILHPARLAGQAALLVADPDLDLAIGGWELMDADGEPFRIVRPWHPDRLPDLEGMLAAHTFILGPLMFRRSLLVGAGGFDPALQQAEDVELILRLLAGGARASWFRETVMRYRQHGFGLTANAAHRVRAVDRVFERFFARDDLSAEVAAMACDVRLDLHVWSAWQMYRCGDAGKALDWLRRSRVFIDGDEREAVPAWVERLVKLIRAEPPTVQPESRREQMSAMLRLCKRALEPGARSGTGVG